jgi:hypothetical protein
VKILGLNITAAPPRSADCQVCCIADCQVGSGYQPSTNVKIKSIPQFQISNFQFPIFNSAIRPMSINSQLSTLN